MSSFLSCSAFCLILIASSCSATKKSSDNMIISGVITHTRTYCGGAAPSEQLLDEYRTPTPLSGLILSIKQGPKNSMDKPIIAEVITDEKGMFKTSLPPGEYILLIPSQTDRTIFNSQKELKITNREELESWWESGIADFNSENTHVEIQLHKKCDVPIGVPYVRSTALPKP